jgi:hypothetical protein
MNFLLGSGSTAPREIETNKCAAVTEAFAKARMHNSAARALLYDASRMNSVDISDISRLLRILIESVPAQTDLAAHSPHLHALWAELPRLVRLLEKHPGDAKLSCLSQAEAVEVASGAIAAAAHVRERSEAHQQTLLASLDSVTNGRFKALGVVSAEERRARDVTMLLLSHVYFDAEALNKLRNLINRHLLLSFVDLSHCFLGDEETKGILRLLERLPHLAVVSLQGNALTDKIVPWLVNDEAPPSSAQQQQQQQPKGDDDDNSNNNNGAPASAAAAASGAAVAAAAAEKQPPRRSHRGVLMSQDKFMALRVLALGDNCISQHHLRNIAAVLAQRWSRSTAWSRTGGAAGFGLQQQRQLALSSAVAQLDDGDDGDAMHSSQAVTTTAFFRASPAATAAPAAATGAAASVSTILSLDGHGMSGVLQAKYLMRHPELLGGASPECIVATSSSAILACAIGLGPSVVPLSAVCNAFMRLEQEVFAHAESKPRAWADAAGQYVRSWWTGGDYYSSAQAREVLADLFGSTRFGAIPNCRVMVLVETVGAGTVVYASSPPANAALAVRAECFSSSSSSSSSSRNNNNARGAAASASASSAGGPTIVDVCLAAWAAPGYFAPRSLPTAHNSRGPAVAAAATSAPAAAAAAPGAAALEVLDASGSVPNPALYALLEALQPSAQPRRLVSIACDAEAHVSSVPASGVAALSASALSLWPAERADAARREAHFARLVDAHGFTARAVHDSIQRIVDSGDTHLSYQRVYPVEADAPSLLFGEPSLRVLRAALSSNADADG